MLGSGPSPPSVREERMQTPPEARKEFAMFFASDALSQSLEDLSNKVPR